MRHMGINLVPVTRCHWSDVVGEWVEIDNGVPGDHIMELRCDDFRGGSL